MKQARNFLLLFLFATTLRSCGIYSFSGVNIQPDIKTYTVLPFENTARLVIPGFAEEFRLALVDKIQNMTDLDYTDRQADLIYAGKITRYYIQPAASTGNQQAALNRLTVEVEIDFKNRKHPDENFTKSFSYYYEFPANKLPDDIRSEAHEIITEQITQDIFNETLAKW